VVSTIPTVTVTPSSTPTPIAASGGGGIGTGSIVGIVIGGGALICGFILALIWMLKKKGGVPVPLMYEGSPSTPAARTDPHSSYMSNQRVQTWSPPIAEMEHTGSPDNAQGSFVINSMPETRRD